MGAERREAKSLQITLVSFSSTSVLTFTLSAGVFQVGKKTKDPPPLSQV